ncbi:MAG: hypothetical protein Q4E06_06255 [Lautropia sp.]|nr:hypothetical protein [Lautropia sp.]
MKAKNVVLVLATTGLISSQSLAAEVDVKAPASPQTQAAFTEADASTLFEASGKPMQVAALSSVEMKETEGAAFPFELPASALTPDVVRLPLLSRQMEIYLPVINGDRRLVGPSGLFPAVIR